MPKKADTLVTTENEVVKEAPKVEPTRTVEEQIKYDYDNGAYSPLQLSFIHNVEVDVVLRAIGQAELLEVQIVGDQIDDAGPGVAINPGTRVKVPYTKN